MRFFRFPRTPHLAWLGAGVPRDDKVLSDAQARAFLAQDLIVEEKVDGANVGLSMGDDGRIRTQNRGHYLSHQDCHPQFRPLFIWLAPREQRIAQVLGRGLIAFGEWCYAVHSIRYTRLPDWFLLLDVYDVECDRFWSTRRRDALACELGLVAVPTLAKGNLTLASLRQLFQASRFSDTSAEGLYLRHEDPEWLVERAKLVRPEFTQAIGEHWSRRHLVLNRLAPALDASSQAQAR